jgi:hypothetical protein
MKTNQVLLFVTLVLAACSGEPKINQENQSIVQKNNYLLLDKIFKEITADTFYVESDNRMEEANHKFKGILMDSLQVSLLPNDVKSHYVSSKEFFACYKFKLDSNKVALIARIPGDYVSFNLQLFVLDKTKDSIVNYLTLAEVFLDAGQISSLTSCIFKDKEKNTYVLSHYYSFIDHSIQGNENDTIEESSRDYFLFDITKQIIDTVSKDSAKIVSKHFEIVKQLSKE